MNELLLLRLGLVCVSIFFKYQWTFNIKIIDVSKYKNLLIMAFRWNIEIGNEMWLYLTTNYESSQIESFL